MAGSCSCRAARSLEPLLTACECECVWGGGVCVCGGEGDAWKVACMCYQ